MNLNTQKHNTIFHGTSRELHCIKQNHVTDHLRKLKELAQNEHFNLLYIALC